MALTKVTYSMISGAPVNAKDFGATGDGVTDDTAAIQAAIDSVQATGKAVYLPTGTYKVNDTLTIVGADQTGTTDFTGAVVSLIGDGQNNTVLDFDDFAGVGIEFKGWDGEISNLTIKNVETGIQASRANSDGIGGWTLRNINIINTTNGMLLRGVYFINSYNIRISDYTTVGIQLYTYNTTSDRTNACNFYNCQVYNGNPIPSGCKGVYIVHGTQNNFFGLDVSGADTAIHFAGITNSCTVTGFYEERNNKPVIFDTSTIGNTLNGFISSPNDAIFTDFFGSGNTITTGGVTYNTDGDRPNLIQNSGLEAYKYEDSIYGPARWDLSKAAGSMIACGVGRTDTTSFRGNFPLQRNSQTCWKSDGVTTGAGIRYPENRENHDGYLQIWNRQVYIGVAMIKVVSGNGPRFKVYNESGTLLAQTEKATVTVNGYDGWIPLSIYLAQEITASQQAVKIHIENDTGEAGVWYVDDVYFTSANGSVVTYRTKPFDLSAAGSTDYLLNSQYDSVLYAVRYIYTETTSANAGVTLKLYAINGVTADSLISTYTSEVSKNRGYIKESVLNQLQNAQVNPTGNETIVVDCAGGKTGSGEIVVEYVTFIV